MRSGDSTVYSPSSTLSVGLISSASKNSLQALLQVFYTIRSERMLMEQSRYNMPFSPVRRNDEEWNQSVFSTNRNRMLEDVVVEALVAEMEKRIDKAGLLSREHFSLNGTPIQAWASH